MIRPHIWFKHGKWHCGPHRWCFYTGEGPTVAEAYEAWRYSGHAQ